MTNCEQPVTIKNSLDTDRKAIYDFGTRHGELIATFQKRDRTYCIAGFDVYAPRLGIGKLLLRASLEHAQSLGASQIIASIISRECLDSMREVFGEEHLHVMREGVYANQLPQGVTKTAAVLLMPLQNS